MSSDLTALKSTLSWAIPIPDRSMIPDTFRTEYDRFFAADEAPYLLYNPVQDHLRLVSDEKLIGFTSDRLVVLAANHAPFACRFADVVFFRQEEQLLAYSLTILTENDEARMDYNSACADLFEPLIGHLHLRGGARTGQQEWQRLTELARQDLKFTNYARQILRDSGALLEMVYQPEWIANDRTLMETTLLLLTETELCWVSNERKEWAEEPVYGGIFQIARRASVTGCDILLPAENGLQQLLVTLRGQYHWRIPFTTDCRGAIEQLVRRVGG